MDQKNDNKIEDIREWRNEHGQPDFEYLQSLAKDGSSEGLEKLKSIAVDLDVEFGPGSSAEDLIDRIRSSTQSNSRSTT